MSEEIIREDEDEAAIDIWKLLGRTLRVIRKMWIIIPVLSILAGAIGGFAVTAKYKPRYTSNAMYSITFDDLADTFYGQTATRALAATFPYIISSSDLYDLVCEDMNVKYLNGTISASVLDDTNILTISVRSNSASDAYEILSSVVRIYPDIAIYVVGQTTLNLITPPSVPTSPDNNPNIMKAVLLCAVLGVIAALGICIVIAFVRPTYSTTDEIKENLHFTHVVAIPQIGTVEGTTLSIKDKAVNRVFYDSIGMLRTTFTHTAKHHNTKAVLVTSTMPSEGKTTIAVNLAISLANHGNKTLLIEGDLRNPSILKTLGYSDCGIVFSDVLRGREKLSAALVKEKENLDVLCEKDFNDDASELIANGYLKKLVLAAREKYDYVIVDTPPVTAAADAVEIADYTDGIIYVIRRDYATASAVAEGFGRFRYCKARPTVAVLNRSSSVSGSYGKYRYGYYGRK